MGTDTDVAVPPSLIALDVPDVLVTEATDVNIIRAPVHPGPWRCFEVFTSKS
jgi:hypothetical protein